jgi:hypothetical protein
MSPFTILTYIFFYLSCFIHLSHSLNGFSVELIHRDSSKSPIYHPTETKFQRVYNAVHRSINRAKQFSLNTSITVTQYSVEYFISYSVGSPPIKAYGIIDTGSSLVWLQCQPCNTCFNQTSPIFNPSKSSSYKNIPCSSTRTCPLMGGLYNISCSYGRDVCEYTAIYDNNFRSQGDLSKETLTLYSTSGSSVSFPNTIIGCGHNNKFLFSDQNYSGIVGLGNGPTSLIKQLDSSIEGKFSYCLIPVYNMDSDISNFSNKLNFGDAAVVSGERVVSTPLITLKGRSDYILTLEAFSIGNKRIEYGGSEIEGINSTRNIIIDSGTPITFLPHDFYAMLESNVTKVVKLPRVVVPSSGFSLCYNTTTTTTREQSNIFPIITAHFSGADIKLNHNNTFAPTKEGIMCFAFIPVQGVPIFGSYAQHNFLVGYDLKKNIISFKPTDCTKY